MTFWQAYRRALGNFALALGFVVSAGIVGTIGGLLIVYHHFISTGIFYLLAILAFAALEARSIQRRGF